MTQWRAKITLYADDEEYTHMEWGDPSLNVVLNDLPNAARAFTTKTVARVLEAIRVERPE